MDFHKSLGLPEGACEYCYRAHSEGECPNPNNPKSFFAINTDPNEPLIWERMTPWQKFWTVTGKFFTSLMAIGCGVQIAASFLMLHLMPIGVAAYIVAGIIFTASTLISWYIYKNAVPDVLNDIFGKEGWFQGLFEHEAHCDLVKTNKDPTRTPLNELPLSSETAYLRFEDKLYYINTFSKSQPVLELTNMALPHIQIFDKAFFGEPVIFDIPKKLTRNGLTMITNLTGHSQVSTLKKVLMGIGIFLALSVGITFGALTYINTFSLTSAYGFLAAMTGAFPPLAAVLAVVTAVCLTALMLKDIANLIKKENIWQSCKNFISDLLDFSPRCELRVSNTVPTVKTMAAFHLNSNAAYLKVDDDVYYLNQENKECFRIKDVKASSIYHDQVWTANNGKALTHKELADIAIWTHQIPKGLIRTIAERILSTLLTLAFLPLALTGLFLTQNACAGGLKTILLKHIPKASAATMGALATILSLGFAFLGQIPFVISTAVNTIVSCLSKEVTTADDIQESENYNEELQAKNLTKKHIAASQIFLNQVSHVLKAACLYAIVWINAIGNGLISAVGRAISLCIHLLSGLSGFWNSFAAGFTAVQSSLDNKSQIMKVLYEQQESNRGWRLFGLILSTMVLTPLSLIFILPYWKRAEDNDNSIERIEIPSLDYEMLRQKRKHLNSTAEAMQMRGAELLSKPLGDDFKLPKLVVDTSDYSTKILYVDKHSAQRFRFYANPLLDTLSQDDVHDLNRSFTESLKFVSPSPVTA